MRRARLDRRDAARGCSRSLPQAQAAGQKAQEDAQRGQGSIFDLDDARRGGRGSPRPAPADPGDEFEQRELLAMEKETLGTFLSDHPLTRGPRGAAGRAVDCSLAELDEAPDGAWVTVGGIVTEAKRIRTKTRRPR